MIITQIIERLRGLAPAFNNNVGGIAELAQVNDRSNLPVPHAFVTHSGEKVTNEVSNGNSGPTTRYSFQVNIRINVVLDGSSDDRNQQAMNSVEAVRDDMNRALINFRPAAPSGLLYEPLRYLGFQPVEFNSSRMVYRFDYTASGTYDMIACASDAREAAVREAIAAGYLPPCTDPTDPRIIAPHTAGTPATIRVEPNAC